MGADRYPAACEVEDALTSGRGGPMGNTGVGSSDESPWKDEDRGGKATALVSSTSPLPVGPKREGLVGDPAFDESLTDSCDRLKGISSSSSSSWTRAALLPSDSLVFL
jgi:hypothetical protein